MAFPIKRPKRYSLLLTSLGLTFALIAVPILASLAVFFGTVSQQMQQRAQDTAWFYVDQTVRSSENALTQCRNIAYSLLGNDTIQLVMSDDSTPTGSQKNILQTELGSATLYNHAWDEKYLRSIFLIRNDGTVFPSSRSGLYPSASTRILHVAQTFLEHNSTQTLVAITDAPDYAYLVLDYNDLNSLSRLGKLILEIDVGALINARPLQTVYPGAEVLLSNTTDGTLLASASTRDRIVLASDLSHVRDTAAGTTQIIDWAGDRSLHYRAAIGKMNLDVCIPLDEILTGVRTTILWYVLLTLLILVAALAVGLGAYRMIVRPFAHTQQTLNRMAESDLSVRMSAPEYRELDGLAAAFNRMADTLTDLYEDAYQKGVLLRESEFKMLEAQINPHFIFNVLQVINLRCLEAGQKETSRMVTDLAGLLHGTIGKNGAPKVTFQQELDYVRYYLDLQKARFEDNLTYEIDYADPAILSYYLPKLTIQPLVENSVVHGLEPKRGGGWVHVKIWEEDDSVYIRVEDNGVGFRMGHTESAPSKHNHIALDNIRKRIELMYGAAGTFRIRGTPDCGTVALLIIPIDKTEGEHDVQRHAGRQ